MADKGAWQFTAMIRQPFEITAEMVDRATNEVAAKNELPLRATFGSSVFDEGISAQVMHVVPRFAYP